MCFKSNQNACVSCWCYCPHHLFTVFVIVLIAWLCCLGCHGVVLFVIIVLLCHGLTLLLFFQVKKGVLEWTIGSEALCTLLSRTRSEAVCLHVSRIQVVKLCVFLCNSRTRLVNFYIKFVLNNHCSHRNILLPSRFFHILSLVLY